MRAGLVLDHAAFQGLIDGFAAQQHVEKGFHTLHATALSVGREADYQQASQSCAYEADRHRHKPAAIRPRVGPEHDLVAQIVRLDEKQPKRTALPRRRAGR